MRRRPFWGVLLPSAQCALQAALGPLTSEYPPDAFRDQRSLLTHRNQPLLERLAWHCPETAHVVVALRGTVNHNPYDPRTVRQAQRISKALVGSLGAYVKLEVGEHTGLHLHLVVDARSPLKRGRVVKVQDEQQRGGVVKARRPLTARVVHRKETYCLKGLLRYLFKSSHFGAAFFRKRRRVLRPQYVCALVDLAAGLSLLPCQKLTRLLPTSWLLNLPQMSCWSRQAVEAVRQGRAPVLSLKAWAPVERILNRLRPAARGRGRPPHDDKGVLETVLHKLLARVGWNRVPGGRTAARRFESWTLDGTWEKIEKALKVARGFCHKAFSKAVMEDVPDRRPQAPKPTMAPCSVQAQPEAAADARTGPFKRTEHGRGAMLRTILGLTHPALDGLFHRRSARLQAAAPSDQVRGPRLIDRLAAAWHTWLAGGHSKGSKDLTGGR